jgi:hypothetical protein
MYLLFVVFPWLVLGALTAVIAGTVASLLVFQSGGTRHMMINGGSGTLLSYLIVGLAPVPTLATIDVNGATVYPVWAIAGALMVALLWKIARSMTPPTPTRAEVEAERVRRARQRATKRQ